MEMSSGWKPPPAAGASSAAIATGPPQARVAAANRNRRNTPTVLPATRQRLEILEKGIMRILVRAESKRWLSTCSQTRFSRKHGSSIGTIRTPYTPRLPHRRGDSIGKFLVVCRECEEERFLAVLHCL